MGYRRYSRYYSCSCDPAYTADISVAELEIRFLLFTGRKQENRLLVST